MAKNTVYLSRETANVVRKMGVRIKKARVRRNILAKSLAKQAGISTRTLTSIEKGEFSVSIGAYAAVLTALNMINDFEHIALDKLKNEQSQMPSVQLRKRARNQYKFFAGEEY